MTYWRVTRTWLVEADTGAEAIEATTSTPHEEVRAIVVGVPTGSMARVIADGLLKREEYWRKAIGDEAWEGHLAYWRERFEGSPETAPEANGPSAEPVISDPGTISDGYGDSAPRDGHEP